MSDTTLSSQAKESEEIFRQHSQLIYRTAFAITGHSEDAEDVLQNIFLRLLRREFPPDLSRNPKAFACHGIDGLAIAE